MPLLEAVENEFDAARHSQFVENPKKIVSNDLLLARGLSPRKVALTCYALTCALGIVAYFARQASLLIALILFGLSIGLLLVAAVRLGGLQMAAGSPRTGQAST